MLQVSYIRDNRDYVLERLAVKNFKQPGLVDEIIQLDRELKNIDIELQDAQAKINSASKTIGELKRVKLEPSPELLIDITHYKTKVKDLTPTREEKAQELQQKLVLL